MYRTYVRNSSSLNMSPSSLAVSLLLSCLLLIRQAETTQITVRYVDAENGMEGPECTTNRSVACKTLYDALSRKNINNFELRVKPGVYIYSNSTDKPIELRGAENFTIQRDPDDEGEVIFSCRGPTQFGTFGNLAILYGTNVTLMGITVENCGPNSSGIYVEKVQGLLVTNCTFRDNEGGGMLINNAMSVKVEHCKFMNNNGKRPSLEDRNSLNYTTQNSGGIGLLYDSSSSAEVHIENCTFINCSADDSLIESNQQNCSDNDSLIESNQQNCSAYESLPESDHLPYTYVTFGHGGALFIFLNNASDINVSVSDSMFINCTAHHSGGAITVSMRSSSRYNTMVIHSTSFTSCHAEKTGGGVSVQLLEGVEEMNSVVVEDSNFTSCSAMDGGGALSLIMEGGFLSSLFASPTIVRINRTIFNESCSQTGGSAVGLVSNARIDQFSFVAVIEDSVFTRNRAETQGALLMFRFQVELVGNVTFSDNNGGAVVLFQTRMNITGNVVFEGNNATMGGAVTLQDESFLNLYSGAEVLFLNNRADSLGGALLVKNPSIGQDVESIFNTNCFFQYNEMDRSNEILTPDKWHANVSFVNNIALSAGAAIYAYDISVCNFTADMCPDDNLTQYSRSIFVESPRPFLFKNNYVIGGNEAYHDIATEAHQLSISNSREKISPGDMWKIKLGAMDQSGNWRETLWGMEYDDDSEFHPGGFTLYSLPADPMSVDLPFKPHSARQERCQQLSSGDTATGDTEIVEFFLIEGLNGEYVYKEDINISVACCHPGYGYISEGRTCSFKKNVSQVIPHLLRPESSNRYVYISPGYYAGFKNHYNNNGSFFTVNHMPESFQYCNQEGNRSGCLYKYDNADAQCKNTRKEFMCGTCRDNRSVDLTLRSCIKCKHERDIPVVLVLCVLVVMGCLLILLCNIGVPNDLQGFLFFAQVVGFVYQNGALDDELQWDYHLSRFMGFTVYLPNICPFTNLSVLWTAAFGLLPCLLAITTVTVYILCARVIKSLGQRTVFRGIWLIVLFVYKYVADTVSNLLKCVSLNDGNVFKLVFYFDGSITCFEGEHLPFAIVALLLLVSVVLLGPVFIILISFKRYKTTQAFTDVITDGVRLERRWWGGFDLIRRLMFIVFVTLFDLLQPDYTQLALCLVCIVVMGIFCFSKPYSDLSTNIIETIILLDLLAISFVFLNSKERVNVSEAWFQILLILPFIYALLNIIFKSALKLWTKHIPVAPKEAIKTLSHKVQSQLKPTRSKTHPRGLLMKNNSVDRTGEMDDMIVLGDDEGLEGGRARDLEYIHYREELLDS